MTTNSKNLNPEPLQKERGRLPKTLVIVLAVILVEVALAVAVFFIVIYSGAYNVAATEPHFRSTLWVLSTAMDRSVRQHASGIGVSETFKSPDLPEGYEHYREMCVICHGAPGVQRSEIGEGLYPGPPDLKEAVGDLMPSEVYWIVKNGIKMSGMPAFGPTHDENKLWNIAAFVKCLPEMSAEQYSKMSNSTESAGHSHQESK